MTDLSRRRPDMPGMLKLYHELGFDGPVRVDHVPTMAGESNEQPG